MRISGRVTGRNDVPVPSVAVAIEQESLVAGRVTPSKAIEIGSAITQPDGTFSIQSSAASGTC